MSAPADDRADAPGAEATLEEAKPSENDALEALIPDGLHGREATAPHAARASTEGEPRLRTARLVAVHGRDADVLLRRGQSPIRCEVAPEVEVALLEDVAAQGGSVLVEQEGDGVLLVVGVLATRRPQTLELKAGTVTIEGEREILLRSGRGAIRIREDGDIEVVGTRISATSRGLFRLVGRLLRLN